MNTGWSYIMGPILKIGNVSQPIGLSCDICNMKIIVSGPRTLYELTQIHDLKNGHKCKNKTKNE